MSTFINNLDGGITGVSITWVENRNGGYVTVCSTGGLLIRDLAVYSLFLLPELNCGNGPIIKEEVVRSSRSHQTSEDYKTGTRNQRPRNKQKDSDQV